MAMTAVHHFEVNKLWVDAASLGFSGAVDFEGCRCVLRCPSRRDDFDLDRYTPASDVSALGGWNESGGVITRAAVLLVQVRVDLPGDLRADQAPFGVEAAPEVVAEAHEMLERGADIARRLLAQVLAWIRVDAEQYWLEPQHLTPRVTWLSALLDAEGERLAIGYNDPLTINMLGDDQQAVTPERLQSALDYASTGRGIPLPESLLADAHFYAWQADQPNPRLGLMLAAVALETKIKTFMSEVATEAQRGLVDLVLGNPRDVTVAVVSLLDKGLIAMGWPSLRDEDKEQYKAVTLLFEHRNRFAHRGGLDVTDSEVRADILAARRAFAWLDGLPDTRAAQLPAH